MAVTQTEQFSQHTDSITDVVLMLILTCLWNFIARYKSVYYYYLYTVIKRNVKINRNISLQCCK